MLDRGFTVVDMTCHRRKERMETLQTHVQHQFALLENVDRTGNAASPDATVHEDPSVYLHVTLGVILHGLE